MDLIVDHKEFPIRVSKISRPSVQTLSKVHRYWRNAEDEGYLERFWPEGNNYADWIPTIRRILTAHLPELASAEITYFAAGTFHRLYRIANPDSSHVWLFRVAIPADPVFKTESEVATMEYVRRHTSLPVPRVLAFSSSDNNELGYEWILMEMLPGVSLRSVWGDMPYDAKVQLFVELAGYVNELLALRFSKLGNIYFADVVGKLFPQEVSPSRKPTNNMNTVDVDIGPNCDFVVGRTVSQEFFFEKRVHLNASRGPFQTSREWFQARLELLGKRLQNLSVYPEASYYCENDRELEKNWNRIDKLFYQLKRLVPRLVRRKNGPEDVGVLWHDDLSEHNLLVDPTTFKLTGVIDWESVGVVPSFECRGGLPACLSDRDNKPAPLVLIARGEDSGYIYDKETKKLRNEAEQRKLREVYLSSALPLYDDTSMAVQWRAKAKQSLSRQLEIGSFQHRPWATEQWMIENGFIKKTSASIGGDLEGTGTNYSDTNLSSILTGRNGALGTHRAFL
ncbi:hypothetical protein N656DRAFT_787225 [Canariomyces notabilis]|uniref:Aminoglycoside phosphotransferase domain-containing protein n=1 Tax=Canariomyces notabilis TaxID=2074819 RepID=A0AAN6YVF9_9PEZI|nr:hypothetical protein N656DRAFT_787225 [Canariomyces arenarius]